MVFTQIAQALAPFYQSLEECFFRLTDWGMRVFCGTGGEGELVDLDGARIATSPHETT